MGEGRGHVPTTTSLENVKEKRAAAATAAVTARIKSQEPPQQQQHVVPPPFDNVPSPPPQKQQNANGSKLVVLQPSVHTPSATTTTTTTTPTIQYRYQPGIYRFRCYGALTLHQERPLRTIKNHPLPTTTTTSRMVCQGIATQLELLEPFVHAASAQQQFFQQDDDDDGAFADRIQRHHHKTSVTTIKEEDDPPVRLADLQHPDDLETFIEEQRAFVWTSFSGEANHTTSNTNTNTITIPSADNNDNDSHKNNNTDKDNDSSKNKVIDTTNNTKTNNTDKVWNKWISRGATDVDLLILRKEGTLLKPQGSTMQWYMHPTKGPQHQPLPQPIVEDPNAPAASQILGVFPKPVLGIGKHEVGFQKDGTIYRGTYSQTSIMGILQISLYRMNESTTAIGPDGSTTESLDYKTRASQIQAFWKKVLINMKREVVFLKSEISSDFGERWYKMSTKILEKFPKTAEKTAQTIVKFVRGYWPNDD